MATVAARVGARISDRRSDRQSASGRGGSTRRSQCSPGRAQVIARRVASPRCWRPTRSAAFGWQLRRRAHPRKRRSPVPTAALVFPLTSGRCTLDGGAQLSPVFGWVPLGVPLWSGCWRTPAHTGQRAGSEQGPRTGWLQHWREKALSPRWLGVRLVDAASGKVRHCRPRQPLNSLVLYGASAPPASMNAWQERWAPAALPKAGAVFCCGAASRLLARCHVAVQHAARDLEAAPLRLRGRWGPRALCPAQHSIPR